MTNTHTDIIVAAYGWVHADWNESFYPEDLPEDWQLSYYSNEFRAVVVPASEWTGEDSVDIERWMEDTSEEFIFYLEVTDVLLDWVKFAEAVKPLGEYLGGILLRPAGVDGDLAMIASCLDAAVDIAPVCVLLPAKTELSEAGRGLLRQHGVSQAWDVGDGAPTWTKGGFAVARVSDVSSGSITSSASYTPRQWRETIEQCLRCEIEGEGRSGPDVETGSGTKVGLKRQVLLMVEQESTDIDALRAAVMIGDMLVIPDIE